MDNRNFTSFIDLLSRIRVEENHPLYPQLEAFRFETNKLIALLSYESSDNPLPQPMVKPIVPGSKALAKANSPFFASMRQNGWVVSNADFFKTIRFSDSGLINDAERGESIVFDGNTYVFSPEFRYENLEAVKIFVNHVLPLAFLETEPVPLFLRAWTQEVYSTVESKLKYEAVQLGHAIEPIFEKRPMVSISNNGTTFISYDENGDIFLDVINSNFKITSVSKNSIEKHIPGTIQMRFKYNRNNDHPEQSGFQLQWMKISNPELGKFVFSELTKKDYEALKVLMTSKEISKDQKAETQQYAELTSQCSDGVKRALDVLGSLQELEKSAEEYDIRNAINEMTTQILQDPFNPALAYNYFNLSVGLPNGEEIKKAMQKFVSEVRLMYAPQYVKELLPKVLAKLGDTLIQSSIENLIVLQALLMKMNLLPGGWGDLAKKMRVLLSTPAWELTMLRFRLKDYLTGFREFLLDPAVYQQLLINLEDFAPQNKPKNYNVIFANLPKTYANPLLIKHVKTSKDLEPSRELVDLAIYLILEDLIDRKGNLALDITAILNAHSPQFIQDTDSKQFSYDLSGIILSYLDNLLLPQMDPNYQEKFREAFSKRFQEWQETEPKFLLNYKSLLSLSISALSSPLIRSARDASRYPKMWKKDEKKHENENLDKNKPESDKPTQGSKEEGTKKPGSGGKNG